MQRKNNKDITIVILSFNEEDVIADAVNSAFFLTPNILLIDSFSLDRTVKIAKNLGVKVVIHNIEDFASQRNFALKHVTTKWIYYLDADEQLLPDTVNEINEIVSNDRGEFGGYFIKRNTYYFGKEWGLTDQVQRLFRREALKEWQGVVHETPEIDGTFGKLVSPIRHNTHRNLSQMIKKTNEWSAYEARLRYNAGHPTMNPLRFMRVILTGFLQSYINNKGYKNGTYGIIESMYQSYSMFVTYAKLWEMQELGKNEKSVNLRK